MKTNITFIEKKKLKKIMNESKLSDQVINKIIDDFIQLAKRKGDNDWIHEFLLWLNNSEISMVSDFLIDNYCKLHIESLSYPLVLRHIRTNLTSTAEWGC